MTHFLPPHHRTNLASSGLVVVLFVDFLLFISTFTLPFPARTWGFLRCSVSSSIVLLFSILLAWSRVGGSRVKQVPGPRSGLLLLGERQNWYVISVASPLWRSVIYSASQRIVTENRAIKVITSCTESEPNWTEPVRCGSAHCGVAPESNFQDLCVHSNFWFYTLN